MRNDWLWLCGRAQALHRHLVRIISWQLPEREEREKAGLDYQVGYMSSFEGFSNIESLTQNHCAVIAFGQWLSALEFVIYKLNECSISFTRETLEMISYEGTHFIARGLFINVMENIFIVFMSQ